MQQLTPGVGAPFAGVGLQFAAKHEGEKIVHPFLIVDQSHLGNRHLWAGRLARTNFVHRALVVIAGNFGANK